MIPLRALRVGSAARQFGLYLGIDETLRRHRGAVLHAFGCMPSYLTFAAMATARRRRHPVVWTPMFHPLRRLVWERRRALRLMTVFDSVAPRAAMLTDLVAAATEVEAARFVDAGARRVEILPPVVEEIRPSSPHAAALLRARHGLSGAPLIVSVISRDEPRKGLAFAFETLRTLRADVPAARLLVVGLESTTQPIPEGVVLAGRLSDDDVAASLRAADVVFVPSLFEAFSRVVIEAWQQETPVVVADGVALAPTVDGAGGLVVAYGDRISAAQALKRLVDEPELANAWGQAGAALVRERFMLDDLASRTARLYEELSQP